jgi:hypothetical protein
VATLTGSRADVRAVATGTRRARPPATPASRSLLLASLLTIGAALLPWVATSFGTFWGLDGPGRWTLYAGFLGLAGAIVRRPGIVATHAAVLGLVAIGMPAWQLARLTAVCPPGGCLPSAGLLLTGLAGAMALRAAWLAVALARDDAPADR